jgi:putative DNA primase/helicase
MGIISAEKVEMLPIEWIWPYRFAAGEMALIAGDGGLGKSSLLLAIAGIITRGGEWPDKSGRAPLGSVIVVSAEDSRETTLKPRLVALGADLAQINFVVAKVVIKKTGSPPMVNPKTLQDVLYWKEVIRRSSGCKMMIVDPIPSYLGRGINDGKNAELRSVLEPFIELVARPAGICLAANTHLNKNIGTSTPLHRITGNTAYGNLPRNVHFVVRDPDNADKRIFKQAKCNNAPDDLPAVAYSLIKAMIPSVAGEIEAAFPVFESEPVKVDLGELMNPARRPGPKTAKTTDLAKWLLDYLRRERTPVPKGAVYNAAGDAGLIGEYGPQKDGKLRWSAGYALSRAFHKVPMIGGDDAGWIAEELQLDGRKYWQAVAPMAATAPPF